MRMKARVFEVLGDTLSPAAAIAVRTAVERCPPEGNAIIDPRDGSGSPVAEPGAEEKAPRCDIRA
ncbi:hypothetical protein SB4_11025 [Sphingomonas sanguinis]|uniref:Uncharacterized protein n=2 Tax=Sphingomonas sanguinis TaxID=33051 RepID=A0A147ISY2_9SPHN|nr:hypothetical protein SB4_11025 [Sphingomonas sanguinis]